MTPCVAGRLIALASASLLAGCATKSPFLADYYRNKASRLDKSRAEAASGSGSVGSTLQGLGPLPDPLDAYQARLREQLIAMTPGSKAIVREEVLLAFPRPYNEHIRAHALGHLAVSRRLAAQGKLPEAEGSARSALEAAARAVSPVALAELTTAAHAQLAGIYRKQGSVGKALLSKLNQDLLNDYLASRNGTRDFYIERQLEFDFLEQLKEVDAFLDAVNEQREEAALRRMDRTLIALSAVSVGVNTMAADRAAARGDTAGAMNYRFNANLAAFAAGAMQAKSAGEKVGLDSLLNSFALPTLAAQLIDPNTGPRTPEILKSFAHDAAKAEPALRGSSEVVARGVDDVVAVRGGGDMEKVGNAVDRFASILSQFQARVQGIGPQ